MMSLIASTSYFSCITRFQSNNDIYSYPFDNSYGSLSFINTPHTLSSHHSLSPSKNIMVHFSISMIPFPQPPLASAMECQGHNGVTSVQEYDQLDRLQTVYNLLYGISLALDHLLIIPVTSLMKPSFDGILRKHWQN